MSRVGRTATAPFMSEPSSSQTELLRLSGSSYHDHQIPSGLVSINLSTRTGGPRLFLSASLSSAVTMKRRRSALISDTIFALSSGRQQQTTATIIQYQAPMLHLKFCRIRHYRNRELPCGSMGSKRANLVITPCCCTSWTPCLLVKMWWNCTVMETWL
jgi:hypothetical protein